jgi:hypothetical protein
MSNPVAQRVLSDGVKAQATSCAAVGARALKLGEL